MSSLKVIRLHNTIKDSLSCKPSSHVCTLFWLPHRGTEEYYGLSGAVDIINSTLGKALGGASGGYTTGPKELINLLRQRSRPYLFSNTLPPPVVAGASKVHTTMFQT